MQKIVTVNYPLERVFNYMKNGNNFISKSLDKVKLNSAGTTANTIIPGIGMATIRLKENKEENTIRVYSAEIGTTISAWLCENDNREKTDITFTINCNPNLGVIKNAIIKMAMPKVMDVMIAEVKKAVM